MDVSEAIANRVTTKMLGNPDQPLPVRQDMPAILKPLLATAGWAPFHRPAHTSHRDRGDAAIVEPWRFHALDTPKCRHLLTKLKNWPEKSGKILNMLAACDALIQVTWLPDPSSSSASGAAFEASEENMEHIAAAAAALQNFLTAATAAGLLTYWSSGGILRSQKAFETLGIPFNQILLGSVFVFPNETAGQVEIMAGKQRVARSAMTAWTRWVS